MLSKDLLSANLQGRWIYVCCTASTFYRKLQSFLWGKLPAHSPCNQEPILNLYPERRDSRVLKSSHRKEGYLTLSPGGGRENKKEKCLLEVPEHCDPKWPRLLVSLTYIHISTMLAQEVDIRLLHRKHFLSKTAEFSVGEIASTQPMQSRTYSQLVPRAEGQSGS